MVNRKTIVYVDDEIWVQTREVRIAGLLLRVKNERINRQGDMLTVTLDAVQRAQELTFSPKLDSAPGFKLKSWLTSICPKRFGERELGALHADSLELYYERLQAGDKAGARRVRLSMYGWMLWTVVGGIVSQLAAAVLGKLKSSE